MVRLSLAFGAWIGGEVKYFRGEDDDTYSRSEKYHELMRQLGWTVQIYGLKKVSGCRCGKVVEKQVDVDLAVELVLASFRAPPNSVFILIATDSDFENALGTIRALGRQVYLLHWRSSPTEQGMRRFYRDKWSRPGDGVGGSDDFLFLDDLLDGD